MRTIISVAALATLSACGGASDNNQFAGRSPEEIAIMGQGDGGPPFAAGAGRGQAGAQGTARTADELGLDCNTVAAQRGEGPDVAGVTIGMSADQALQKLACSNRALRVASTDQGGFGLPPLPDGRRPRTAITGDGGSERVVIGLVGLPGQERVVTVRRTLEFAAGQEPVITSTIAQLEQKYGALARASVQHGAWTGQSLRDANNRPIPEDSLLSARCALSVGMQVGEPDLQGDCGLSVSATIEPSSGNEQLASKLVVSMNNGAFGIRQVEAYQAVARGAARQQQSQEVDQAAGRRPTL